MLGVRGGGFKVISMNRGLGMKVKKADGCFLATLGALTTVARGAVALAVLLGLMSCVPRAGDINLVQPGYVRKAIFQADSEWYYRRTIVKSETTNAYAVEGMGDWAIDRVKFEIQENVLIAYRPYDSIPGTGTGAFEGSTGTKGTVLAAWPIDSHFDIQRGYDSLSNRVTNVIDENTEDLPWYDRQYMRVDFSTNLIEDQTVYGGNSSIWFPLRFISTGSYWTNLDTRPTDQYASRFSDDYVEVTDHVMLGMDYFTCAAFAGYNFFGTDLCGFGEAKVRHSFMRVDQPTDYVPRYYPDSVIRKDEEGYTVFDPETGEVVRENIYSRFGVFRIQLPTYDRGYGYTESGRLWRARLFNLWQRLTDDNGNVLPYSQRTPKPIIYYLNAEFPMRWKRAADVTAEQYNRVYTSMVADMMGTTAAGLEQAHGISAMFEIRVNDCNEQNIIDFVSNEPDLFYAVERAVCVDGGECGAELSNMGEHIGVGNLKTVCTSLEAATTDPETGTPRFTWQRIGDVRNNMLVYFNNPQQSGWGGLGTAHSDSRTGETISATAYIRGFYYEVGAATVNDYVEFINDEQSITDAIYGQQIRQHIATTLERRQTEGFRTSSRALADRLDQRISTLGVSREDKLFTLPNPDHLLNRMKRVKGTRLTERLVNDQDIALAGYGTWRPGEAVDEDLFDRATPWGRISGDKTFGTFSHRARLALAESGFCFLEAEFDPHWAGLALNLRDLDREQRYEEIAIRLLSHLFLHEIGHNVGLTHNFEGTYDALNYDPAFWDNACVDGVDADCDDPAVAAAYAENQRAAQFEEYRHSTVMEYMSNKGLFADFLGKYDEAAIRFAYAEQVEVFTHSAVQAPGGDDLRQWRYLNDYRALPNYLCGGRCSSSQEARSVLSSRQWVTFDPQDPPDNEVPYLFCDDRFDRMTPFCSTFDYGSSLTEVFMNYKSMWQDYFFFNNFIRDRLTPLAWDPNQALRPATYVFDFSDVVSQYFYIMSVNAQADPSDPFAQSYLRDDMASVLGHTLNFATEVMATPEPGRMCVWTSNPTVYLPYYNLSNCDQYAPLESDYAVSVGAIQTPLGDGRPSSISFTEDYEDWDWAYVGSFFDKTNTLLLLGWTQPRLFRFNYDLDARNFYISHYRLFEPELTEFYNRIMTSDGGQQSAVELGSYWCRSEDAPDLAYLGHFEPRRMIDLETLEVFPGPSEDCIQPGFLYPTLLTDIPFNAMFYAHALFSSDFDAQLDMGKELKIFVRGAEDDFDDWAGLPNCDVAEPSEHCLCTMTDTLTGLEYRGLRRANVSQSISCRLIEAAQDAQFSYEASGRDPFNKDLWRLRIEQLEYARDLYRVYHNR